MIMLPQEKVDLPFLDGWYEWTNDAVLDKQLSTWVRDFRQASFARYRMLGGAPSSKVESWKYTDLRSLATQDYQLVQKIPLLLPDQILQEEDGLLSIPGPRLVLVNGCFSQNLSSLPSGIEIHQLSKIVLSDSDSQQQLLRRLLPQPDTMTAMVALNSAWFQNGLLVRFTRAAYNEADRLLHVILVSTFSDSDKKKRTITHPCLVVVVESGNRVSLIEHHIGLATSLTNLTSTISIAGDAVLVHILTQSGISDASVINSSTVNMAASSLYQKLILSTGLGLVRNELSVTLSGTGAKCHLHGAYVANSGDHHVDNTISVDHIAPLTESRQVFKGILNNSGRGVFQSRVIVRRSAKKSDSKQLHKALLLSQHSKINCKPELEIYADDVKCSHGATVGQLAEDVLFYLTSRGLGIEAARILLIEGFLCDVIDEIIMDEPILHEAARTAVLSYLNNKAVVYLQ